MHANIIIKLFPFLSHNIFLSFVSDPFVFMHCVNVDIPLIFIYKIFPFIHFILNLNFF